MNSIIAIAASVGFSALLTVITHRTAGRRWAGNELARRGIGWLIIITPTALFSALGLLDWLTWLAFVLSAGAAGAVLYLMVSDEEMREKARRVTTLRARVIQDGTVDASAAVAGGERDSGGTQDIV